MSGQRHDFIRWQHLAFAKSTLEFSVFNSGIVARAGQDCAEDDLRAFCETHLGSYKTPRIFRFVRELPRGPSGKVQRLKLLDAAGN